MTNESRDAGAVVVARLPLALPAGLGWDASPAEVDAAIRLAFQLVAERRAGVQR